MNSFRKILIANRGEIAVRVARTCRAMGIATVAVYSDADAGALHVRACDEAVLLGAAPAQDSYLNIDKLIAAARATGAEAIHPGYGFLSERAEFAEGCAASGIVFIGPRPAAMRAMGLKSPARQLAVAAGVSVVPGYDGDEQDEEKLRAELARIGLPVLIKASAGGGGKGMRVVRDEAEVADAIAGARREAEKSFGEGALLLEKYVEGARHIEVQILGDEHGNLVHLFERDCSVQRRYQKIVEESPSPAVDDALRARLGEAAIKIGRALNYTNAGTVEFILAPTGEFYFIEVNTRLQVEHPVTEMITGLDLVRMQIGIAEGRALPFTQEELQPRGHAIEARLYAEDPANDFLPATGTLRAWRLPEGIEGLRVDAGVARGSEVGIHYDPMLAKLIAHGTEREEALRRLRYGLRQLIAQGVRTNQAFLLRLLEHEAFAAGRAHTGVIAEHLAELITDADDAPDRASAIAAALYLQCRWQAADTLLAELPATYRNNPFRHASIKLQVGARELEVAWRQEAPGEFVMQALNATARARVFACRPRLLDVALDGVRRAFHITEAGAVLYVHSSLGAREVVRLPRHPLPQAARDAGTMSAPMPGRVLKVLVGVGQTVKAGEPLLVLEAMKMEQTIRAATDGLVDAIHVQPGQIVSPGDLLVRINAVV